MDGHFRLSHQPVLFSFFCLRSGSRCAHSLGRLSTLLRLAGFAPDFPNIKMLEDKWETISHKKLEVEMQDSDPGRLAGLTCCLADILFSEHLTLPGPLFPAVTVYCHLFHFPVSRFAFRNPHGSRKGKSSTRFSGKIYGMCFPSSVCASVFSCHVPTLFGLVTFLKTYRRQWQNLSSNPI